MAESSAISNEDPLIAALPPATDSITYLTLLEYQLTPQNLSTLNRLLSEDSGTLAEEIGWDLLRLVLPMLEDVPEDAANCLEIIARRGNPREVVVRIAEELEKMGHHVPHGESEGQLGSGDDEDTAALPTFAGEAKRIHLGEMKLEGMPESEKVGDSGNGAEKLSPPQEPLIDTEKQDTLSFQALLSMLYTVHPRIKTQYPSRFFATSLPAALGAYRRLSASHTTTVSFLDCLKKLSSRPRPPLPPRSSLESVPVASDVGVAPVATAPLADPEASTEASSGGIHVSDNEKAIISRLLQAVLVEVIDEYMSSMQSQDSPCMSWTSRLREKLEPGRVVPGKPKEADLWQKKDNLKGRDKLMDNFISLTGELGMDPLCELKKVVASNSSDLKHEGDPDAEDDEPSEYPTSPSQIPFATTGLLLLVVAQQFTSSPKQEVDKEVIPRAFDLLTPLSVSPSLPIPAVQDALHCLLYQTLTRATPPTTWDESTLVNLISILTQTFTTNPHPHLRDDAHRLATKLLHNHGTTDTRLGIIKQTMRGFVEKHEPNRDITLIPLFTPLTEGALKAVGVDWLKDEFLMFRELSNSNDQSQNWASTPGIDPAVVDSDEELSALVFPRVLPAPSITGEDNEPQDRAQILLPFYISIINMCCVLCSTTSNTQSSLQGKATVLLTALDSWREYLLSQLSEAEEVKESAPEIFALEDACQRLRIILFAKEDDKPRE